MPYETTLNAIRACHPCSDGWQKLLHYLGKTKADDETLSISTILESNGLDDALWALKALPPEHDNAVRLLACDFAERALCFVPESEGRPKQAIEVSRRFARGKASLKELEVAKASALAAAAAQEEELMEASWAKAATRAAEARAASWAARAAAATEPALTLAAERAEQERLFRAWLNT